MRRTLPLVVGALALTACSRDGRALRPPTAAQNQSIVTTSTSTTRAPSVGNPDTTAASSEAVDRFVLGLPFADAGTIPVDNTCKGAGTAPRVTWAQTPGGTKELALAVVDDTAVGTVQWVITGIDPALGALDAGVVPAGAAQAVNGTGSKGWAAPCPPPGVTHRYRFTLYALSAPTGMADGADSGTALAAVARNVLALDVVFGLAQG